MNMKRLLSLVAFFATLQASAQQVNPVPDYVFRNQMSVGRGTVTDTAAYFSIGPRYGATKGFMPPIVGDTATFSSGKRNGLLIFSVQKNKFLYWDSVRVQWSDMAGSSGAYIVAGDTSAMLAPYLRKADTTAMLTNYVRHAGYGLTKSGQSFLVDTLNIATRAWRQKGLDSLAALEVSGSGTTNYVAKFTAGSTIGNSQIFDNGTNVGIGITTGMSERFNVASSTANANASISSSWASGGAFLRFGNATNADGLYLGYNNPAGSLFGGVGGANGGVIMGYGAYPIGFGTNGTERLRIFANGRVFVGSSPTDAGYQLDVNGDGRFQGTLYTRAGTAVGIQMDNTSAIRNAGTQYFDYGTGGTGDFYIRGGSGYSNFLTLLNGGNLGISTASPSYKLDINGTLRSVNGANFATTSGNVGIGTTTAGGKLTINSALGDHIQIQRSGLTDRAIVISASDQLVFGTWAVPTQMALTNAGELLINTTSDAGDYKLQVAGNIYGSAGANLAMTSGNVGVGLVPAGQSGFKTIEIGGTGVSGLIDVYQGTNRQLRIYNSSIDSYLANNANGGWMIFRTTTSGGTQSNALSITDASELLVNTSTDAGDYKLQIVGNARIGTGKLDIASNTTFGLGVARSGTSEVAGQIYNSNGILYFGAESSAGGQIFSGSSAYAAVIGSGANYPLQFAVNNITRGGFSTSGNLLLGFTTDSYFLKLQVNGSIFSNNQFFGQGANAQLSIDSSTNISPLYVSAHSLTGSSAQGLFYGSTTWNTTGNPSLIDLAITNTASGSDANYIKISDGSNIFRVTKAAEVVTAAPSGGSIKPWKLGEAATVSPTSPNRTIRVEIDGTVYYLHAKTTND